ncbi:helix-turn-helix transcriptional regulator [Sphingomonas sp. QA11]|uniref:helix-turn-helix domain-containing protein n=1 Tax=Sphingomonas sp. QA11 TaxID=2950605 RepID=UPI002348FAAF|nr:helix-turn-helix transcriptional regulator [Sphingomonas sp. QA11]WCM27080.1 helix-turn-helix transcriptional regulator [Sphingomonas sp. QA11]
MTVAARNVGDHLREWRRIRRLSQLDLALDAEISARHLSFLETGRARPSREMVLRLSEQLDMPMRERNLMLTAAGFAPLFGERSLDDPEMAGARRAIDLILAGHEPWPALAVDRHWNLVASNRGVAPLLIGVDPLLLDRPNVMRLALHPQGLAPRILNLAEWRHHLIARLKRQAQAAGDADLDALVTELDGYPAPPSSDARPEDLGGIAVPLKLLVGDLVLSFLSTTTVFGTAQDVTLAELTLETFFPADAATAEAVSRTMAASG